MNTLRVVFSALLIGGAAMSCSGGSDESFGTDGTALHVVTHFDAPWQLSQLSVEAEKHQTTVPEEAALLKAPMAVTISLNDAAANKPLDLTVWGLANGTRVAHGEVTANPRLHETVEVAVALSRLPCGAWCTEGSTSCAADGVRTCEQRDSDSCFEWSESILCPADAPFCSLGQCSGTCVDECADGETRCAGPGGLERCGEVDSDPCKDWLPTEFCAEGLTCDGGVCVDTGKPTECTDECAAGTTQCSGAGVSSCGHYDADDCLDWGPTASCPSDQSCSGGACAPTSSCQDECSESTCQGGTWKQCGNFDLDPCTELSPGASCQAADGCLEGACSAVNGCSSAPKVCEMPPANMCVNASTLRVYNANGACAAGACDYAPMDVACPNCPACNACAGVTCDQPQSVCFQANGTCTNGSCFYDYANGAGCDDGNACTIGDTCSNGACAGTPKLCNSPSGPTCINASTLRTYGSPGSCAGGNCSYPETDTNCPNGCAAGACVVLVAGWSPITTSGAPSARSGHTAVWTGTEMLIWGGSNNTGGRYNPTTDTWATITTVGAPEARYGHTAIWTGSEMVIWGGHSVTNYTLNTGGRYNPATNSWIAMSAAGAPEPRHTHTAVWTGSEMIVWGGDSGSFDYVGTGGKYNLSTNSWVQTTTSGAPSARYEHTAVWTGTQMLVWGGNVPGTWVANGRRYIPSTDTWSFMPDAPDPRTMHTAVWTGSEMLVWGFGSPGLRFNPSTNTWTSLPLSGIAEDRWDHTAIWTGSEMIVWGGTYNDTPYSTGARYKPSTNTWSSTPMAGVPQTRERHTAVWTGSMMLVWGGYDDSTDVALNTGGRYVP